jgi:hypothetical protein
MTGDETQRRRSRPGKVDFTMMYAAHDAFHRDMERLAAAIKAGRGEDPATYAGWATFKNQLHIHHTVEDVALWPPLRQEVVGSAEVAVLDAMEAEHALIDPLLAGVDAAFDAADDGKLAENAHALAAALGAHMEHEEDQALPLVEERLGPEGWAAFIKAIRERQGLRGAAEFLPWILDDAPAKTSKRVLGGLPVPARLLYRAVWRPAYLRTPRWSTTAA